MGTKSMKNKHLLVLISLFDLYFLSCEKAEHASLVENLPPMAHAGQDSTISVRHNWFVLDGSRSHDPEDNIITYYWSKIFGPAGYNIKKPRSIQTEAYSLEEGVYQFQLKITDAFNLISMDTVQVIVYPDTLTGMEIIYDSVKWNMRVDPQSVEGERFLMVPDSGDRLPDRINPDKFEVYLKLNHVSNWVKANYSIDHDCIRPYSYTLSDWGVYIKECQWFEFGISGETTKVKLVF